MCVYHKKRRRGEERREKKCVCVCVCEYFSNSWILLHIPLRDFRSPVQRGHWFSSDISETLLQISRLEKCINRVGTKCERIMSTKCILMGSTLFNIFHVEWMIISVYKDIYSYYYITRIIFIIVTYVRSILF